MLSLGKIAAGPGAARYYTDQVADGREEYYSGEGEQAGVWMGSATAAAGLTGEVQAGDFERLLAGGGLRQPVREGAVAGFDMTFRAPKSVSVLWGVADPDVAQQLGEAHDAAVSAALGYLEREACRARRGRGGAVQVRGEGFVAAAFRHRASRAGDPLLHTHVVAGNLTLGPDGRWTALDARHLYRHARTAGFLYQAELRREVVERLGLEWGTVDRGTADLRRVPRAVIEHFSQRRAEILEHMAARGGRSARSAQVAALETRRAKTGIRVDLLREQWRARAGEHGLTADRLRQVLEPGDRAVPFAAEVAGEVLTRDKSVFGRAELLQALAEAQPRGSSVDELEQLADAMLAGEEVVALPSGRVPAGLSEPRFTTGQMLATEHDLLESASAGIGSGLGLVRQRAVREALSGRTLSEEQQAVVADLCLRGDGVSVLRAAAGTGKTFALDAAREAWQSADVELLGCALSARAALELSDQAAIPSVTIAQLLGRLADGASLPRGGVLVVDEAGMVGTRDLARLADAAAQARTKLVLVGDDRQLPEIQAGGAFHALAERMPSSRLNEVHRQSEPWDRAALEALRSGEVERWARAYREHGRITVADSAQSTRAALVNDFVRAGGDRLMIAARREDVRELNDLARNVLQDRGDLDDDELEVAGRRYAAGDRVVGAKNDRHAGILNGQRGVVAAIDAEATRIDVVLDGGRRVRLDASYLAAGHLEHGYAITAHRAQGATVDRTFVLGSEELYREWGYTALSRHRDEARFYIARGDVRGDPELPTPADPLVAGITRLLERRNVKELALDSLTEAQRVALDDDRRRLRETLSVATPPKRFPRAEIQALETTLQAFERTRARVKQLQERVGRLGRRDRAARAEATRVLERAEAEQARHEAAFRAARTTYHEAEAADTAWATAHGPAAARLVAIEREVQRREHAQANAARRLHALDRDPLAPSLDPPVPSLVRDIHDLEL